MDEKLIKEVVRETIAELKRAGMLKEPDKTAYAEMSERLFAYYGSSHEDRSTKLTSIRKALKEIGNDPYFDIIPLYFKEKYTLENIAELLEVEVSTVTRNKKRLCLMLYELAQ